MKAIEIKSKTNSKGHLKLDLDLKEAGKNVKILILMEEDLNESMVIPEKVLPALVII